MAGRNPPRGREGPEDAWGIKQIQELIDLLVERRISEFELEKGEFRIRIKRGSVHNPAPAPTTASLSPLAFASPTPPPAAPPPVTTPTLSEAPSMESKEELFLVKSPIVGTFFAAPTPNAPPFAKLGDRVEVGQVLCIIEAMKLMNEIEAEVAGEVIRVFVKNGQPVEYGQSLFAIKPSQKKAS